MKRPPAVRTPAVRTPAVRTWIGLFRGINVGGRNMLPMKELVALLAEAGFDEVRTYVQSGNVVFRSAGTPAAIGERILVAVADRFGFRPHLLLLSVADLARAAAANPYPEACAAPQFLHLWFLLRSPTAAVAKALGSVRAPSERCRVHGRVLYLHAPEGIGRSKLAARAEALLGVPATARNWRTVTRLLELAGRPR
jgi:uncharacterized protein (DUF1697 family)